MEIRNPIVKQMMVEKAAGLIRDKAKIGLRHDVEIIDELSRVGHIEKPLITYLTKPSNRRKVIIAHIYDNERLAHYAWRRAAHDRAAEIVDYKSHLMSFTTYDGVTHWYGTEEGFEKLKKDGATHWYGAEKAFEILKKGYGKK